MGSRNSVAALLLVALAACGDARQPTADRRPVARATTVAVQQQSGLDQLPRLAEPSAFDAALLRHLRNVPSAKQGKTVLVDVDVDARGQVADVRGVERPAVTGSRAVLVEDDGSSHELVIADDASYLPPVNAALRETRFRPAVRDGRPVPFTLRMTVAIPAAR